MTEFRRIGAGFCGSVWSLSVAGDPLPGHAFKREDGGSWRSLANDFEMHNRVLGSLRQLANLKAAGLLQIQVPQCFRFITANDGWWIESLGKFPQEYSPCNIIQSERIPHVGQHIRELLIDMFCPPSLVAEIKASSANKDCLIRPYLGRRRVVQENPQPSGFKAFSLRNFPLHLDRMELLGISSGDTEFYAKTMAEALAMMHWCGEIDANDVEFVLAPSSELSAPKCRSVISNVLGGHTMWLLDFDCCKTMSMDEKGVDQAVSAFFRNDPYYPRPGSSPHLWEAFRQEYLETSSDIIGNRQVQDKDWRRTLSRAFIEGIEQTTTKGLISESLLLYESEYQVKFGLTKKD